MNFARFHTLCGTEYNVRKNTFFGKTQVVIFIKNFKWICQIGLHSKLRFMERRKYTFVKWNIICLHSAVFRSPDRIDKSRELRSAAVTKIR